MHQSDKSPYRHRPDERPRADIPIAAHNDAECEAGQEHFLDVIAAVEHHRGRKRRQDRRDHCREAQPTGETGNQQNKSGAERDRHNAQRYFVELGIFMLRAKPGGDQCGINECGAVILVRVILVDALFEKVASELVGMHRLICVQQQHHRIR